MTTDPFYDPTSGNIFEPDPLKGRLLLITPLEYVEHLKTKFSADKDAVRCDYVVLDGPLAGTDEGTVDNCLIFQGALIGATKTRIGKGMVIGRIGQKPTDKGNAMWILEPSTDDDKEVARAYLRRFSDASPV